MKRKLSYIILLVLLLGALFPASSAWAQNPAGSKVMVTPSKVMETPSKVFTGPSKSGYVGDFNHNPTPVRYQRPMNQAPNGQRSYYPYRYGYGYGYGYGYNQYQVPSDSERMQPAPFGEGQAQFKPRKFQPQFQPTKY